MDSGPIAQLVSPDSYRGTHNQVVPGSPRKLSGIGPQKKPELLSCLIPTYYIAVDWIGFILVPAF